MNDRSGFHIARATTAEDILAAASLFAAYASSLGIDLAYQNFQAEMDAMPGRYAPPDGALLLARDRDGRAIGCVGLRPIAPDRCCEMKRLYVTPEGRGLGIGQALIDAVILQAKRIGYRQMRLDTLPSMAGAIQLYRKSGFTPIPPYYDSPIKGTIFLAISFLR
jgi:GNAT superfamily N-acetyltransferase